MVELWESLGGARTPRNVGVTQGIEEAAIICLYCNCVKVDVKCSNVSQASIVECDENLPDLRSLFGGGGCYWRLAHVHYQSQIASVRGEVRDDEVFIRFLTYT